MERMPSFIASGFNTKKEYDAWLSSGAVGPAGMASSALPTLGYWKIRGLAAPLRMMFHYKKAEFKEVAYGEDAGAFFGDSTFTAVLTSV